MLEVSGLSKTYGSGSTAAHAIAEVNVTVEEGEFVCIVGPSGCGKTTLLKCMSGLIRPSHGETRLRGERVVAPPPEMAVVFQDYHRSLLPWLTVRKNVELPIRRRRDATTKARLVSEALDAVGLSDAVDRHPWQLSGGMQQRVAIARALAYEPKLLLMDEPFASVDAQTRADLEDLVLRVRRRFNITSLLVTHDIDEAVYMSDRVVILSDSPSTVSDVLSVNLARPRDQVKTKELTEFAQLRSHVYRAITGREGSIHRTVETDEVVAS